MNGSSVLDERCERCGAECFRRTPRTRYQTVAVVVVRAFFALVPELHVYHLNEILTISFFDLCPKALAVALALKAW